jgi:hypothetical protein
MGRTYGDALFNARNIKYIFTQQDSVLKFDYRLYASDDELWHGEELYITLKIPLNTKLVIDENLSNMVGDVNIYDCKQANKKDKATSAVFIMTDNGLQCKVDTLVTAKADSVKIKQTADSTQNAQ